MGFRDDFIWGAATASYQVEGAAYEDGKGLSVWDLFCKEPGRVLEGQTGDVACDHYHRYKEDVQIMKKLGIKAYRFSISWPRILPDGTGRVNEKGIAFYKNLIDELLANGIVPYATLFHWDYPYELQKRGGWLNPDSSDWFAEYVQTVADHLGDKLKHYMTFNEPMCFIGLSFQETKHAPGVRISLKDALQMSHNVMLGHGKAVQVLRARVPGCIVSYAPTGSSFCPATENPEDIEAARKANFEVGTNWWESIGWWSDPVMLGKYPEGSEELFKENMPQIGQNDFKTMCQPLDMYGQNLYYSTLVKSDGKGGYCKVQRPIGYPKNSLGWVISPESMYWVTQFLYDRYKTPLLITENGMACHDAVSLDGRIHDPNRINFTQRYLLELKKSIDKGVDVRGYFHWSLLDNFEWSEGYHERIGLVFVDYATQERIIKDSAYWYKKVIESNGKSLEISDINCFY